LYAIYCKIAYSLFIVTKKWEWGGDWDDGDKVKWWG